MSLNNGDISIEFDHQPRTRIVFGCGKINQLGELGKEVLATTPSAGRNVLLVTDRGLVAAGHPQRGRTALESAGFHVIEFDEVHENPTTIDVSACVRIAEQQPIDLIVGLGGGSSLDTAKGANFILTNGGSMRDYWGVGKATRPMLPMIAVPTTAGTGSECQSFALIADEKTHQKMACGDHKLAPRIALLDPELTLTQPRPVTVHTGVDALTHALETAVTRRRNGVSAMYSREAFRLIAQCLPRVLKNEKDVDARSGMLLGAALAGCAIENSMLGATHSAANPLTAHYNVVHGEAVGLMLPHVMQFNAKDAHCAAVYGDFARLIGVAGPSGDDADASEQVIEFVRKLMSEAGIDLHLASHGVESSKIETLAGDAASQWTAQFNPREVSAEVFHRLYEDAL